MEARGLWAPGLGEDFVPPLWDGSKSFKGPHELILRIPQQQPWIGGKGPSLLFQVLSKPPGFLGNNDRY